jgi:hypothetical protein
MLLSSPRFLPPLPGEGQAGPDYLAWLARDPGARAQVLSFKSYLSGREGGASPSDLAAGADREHVARMQWARASKWRPSPSGSISPALLQFVKNHVEPVIGDVEAVSGFRNAELNSCSGGAKASAHRHFFALDLVPANEDLSRSAMIRSICKIHDGAGRLRGRARLLQRQPLPRGSQGFRKWGPDGKGATLPAAPA